MKKDRFTLIMSVSPSVKFASNTNFSYIFLMAGIVFIFDKYYLTLCIPMDFPIHIGSISMRLLILYIKGSQVEFSKLCVSVSEG